MPTGQVIINNALISLGILEQGGVPSASDSIDALGELNAMWEAWGVDEGLIYAVLPIGPFDLAANVPSYTIGPAANFNTPQRPSRIYQAVFIATVGAASNRSSLKIIESTAYFGHSDLAASASTPDEIYPDYNVDASGYAKIYFWPVPTCPTASKLELNVGVPFAAWSLATNYNLPYGYQDDIQYALAYRLMPRFGVAVAQEVAQLITAMGLKAEARIRGMNSKNRQLPIPMTMSDAEQRQIMAQSSQVQK
jgi:hypothetical protein